MLTRLFRWLFRRPCLTFEVTCSSAAIVPPIDGEIRMKCLGCQNIITIKNGDTIPLAHKLPDGRICSLGRWSIVDVTLRTMKCDEIKPLIQYGTGDTGLR